MNTFKKWKQILIISCTLVFIITGCSKAEKVEEEELEADVSVPVQVEKSEIHEIYDSVKALGKIEANAVYQISAGTGQVEKVYVEAGDMVEADDLLFELEADSLEKNYRAVESQLRTLRDTLKIQKDDQKLTYDRQKELFEAGAISKRELESVELAYEQLKKQYQDAVVSYNNQVLNLKDGIEDQQVRSPIRGVVAAVYIKDSEQVMGQSAIEIMDDSSVKAVIGLTAQQVKRVNQGASAIVFTEGDMDVEIPAHVESINAVPSVASGLYEAELLLESDAVKLKAGEFVEVEILINIRKMVAIPRRSVIITGDTEKVFVAHDNHAVEKRVTTGRVNGDYIEILSGLDENESVVVRGQSFLKDGSAVEVVE